MVDDTLSKLGYYHGVLVRPRRPGSGGGVVLLRTSQNNRMLFQKFKNMKSLGDDLALPSHVPFANEDVRLPIEERDYLLSGYKVIFELDVCHDGKLQALGIIPMMTSRYKASFEILGEGQIGAVLWQLNIDVIVSSESLKKFNRRLLFEKANSILGSVDLSWNQFALALSGNGKPVADLVDLIGHPEMLLFNNLNICESLRCDDDEDDSEFIEWYDGPRGMEAPNVLGNRKHSSSTPKVVLPTPSANDSGLVAETQTSSNSDSNIPFGNSLPNFGNDCDEDRDDLSTETNLSREGQACPFCWRISEAMRFDEDDCAAVPEQQEQLCRSSPQLREGRSSRRREAASLVPETELSPHERETPLNIDQLQHCSHAAVCHHLYAQGHMHFPVENTSPLSDHLSEQLIPPSAYAYNGYTATQPQCSNGMYYPAYEARQSPPFSRQRPNNFDLHFCHHGTPFNMAHGNSCPKSCSCFRASRGK